MKYHFISLFSESERQLHQNLKPYPIQSSCLVVIKKGIDAFWHLNVNPSFTFFEGWDKSYTALVKFQGGFKTISSVINYYGPPRLHLSYCRPRYQPCPVDHQVLIEMWQTASFLFSARCNFYTVKSILFKMLFKLPRKHDRIQFSFYIDFSWTTITQLHNSLTI